MIEFYFLLGFLSAAALGCAALGIELAMRREVQSPPPPWTPEPPLV